ncbi:MAG: sigma-70 family RNA polymerase sigma factor [Pirellulales bacterium]|nr:sigma-70 family RNA polymerase sigma factor [Pirellulales bacterium]
MTQTPTSSQRIQRLLDRLAAGDPTARDELIDCTSKRLIPLARKLLRDFPRLRRWEQTDDVLQNALLRLYRSLQETAPCDPRRYFGLAATMIRRELLDMARHYYGPQGEGAHHASRPPSRPADSSSRRRAAAAPASMDPRHQAEWTEFHRLVERLPPAEREVFELLWYHGLSQKAAADVLEVSLRTVKRLWQSARLQLHALVHGEPPGGP